MVTLNPCPKCKSTDIRYRQSRILGGENQVFALVLVCPACSWHIDNYAKEETIAKAYETLLEDWNKQ